MQRSVLRAVAILLMAAVGLLSPSRATAQVEAVEPYFVTVTRDGIPLKCRDGSPYYAVKNLASGQVLKVDGQSEGWVRVEYPSGLGLLAFVKSEEVASTDGGKSVKLTRPSQLMAVNAAGGERGNWWFLLEKELGAGTTLTVSQTLKTPDGKEYGYLVPAPGQARGYVKREFVRKATPEEVDAYNRAATGSPGAETPKPKPETSSKPAPESAPAPDAQPLTNVTPTAQAPTAAMPPGTGTERPVAKMDALEAMYEETRSKPVEQIELDTVIAEFQRAISSLGKGPENDRSRKMLDQRLKVLKMRADLEAARKKTVEGNQALRKQADDVAAQVNALNKIRQYDVVGKLVGSTVYDGKRLPLMFRVQSPEPTSARTLAYLAPRSGDGLIEKVGRIIGVVGESRFDPSLRVNIITPVRIDVLTPTGEIETVTDGATAAKPATPGKEPQSVVPDEVK